MPFRSARDHLWKILYTASAEVMEAVVLASRKFNPARWGAISRSTPAARLAAFLGSGI